MKALHSKIGFIVLALTAAVSIACFNVKDGNGEADVVETTSSPSKKFTAYHWVWSGGGAAGWCSRRVSILRDMDELPLNTQPEKARIPIVFSTRCSSKISLTWIDDTRIKISHSLGDDPFPTSLSQASHTEDGSVKIDYEFIEK